VYYIIIYDAGIISQRNMSYDPPVKQQSFTSIDAAPLISKDNRVSTFDVCCPLTSDDKDCQICCVGYLAPCCLVGSTREMQNNGFMKSVDPCDGGCNGPCCGICVSSCALTGCFGYIGALINGAVATQCLNVYESEPQDNWCMKWLLMSFCFTCETCAAYKSALRQVDNSKTN